MIAPPTIIKKLYIKAVRAFNGYSFKMSLAGLGTFLWVLTPLYGQQALSQDTLNQTGESHVFDTWKQAFRAEALRAGVSAPTYDREMTSVLRIGRIKELNNTQAEFTKAIWQYLDSAVSNTRIENGIKNHTIQKPVLSLIEGLYGVDSEIMTAIWGLESSYGSFLGTHDILSALATLAYEGRRAKYGRSQLIAALKIIDRGYATRDQLKGSWAGAMGQTQFIPTTYLDYAIDHDGDNIRDLWTNYHDIFASTANYLSRSGYIANTPWGTEVVLPDGFAYTLTGKQQKRAVAQWMSLGIRKAGDGRLGDTIDVNATGYIIVPAGAAGPAFLVFENFKSILRYNNATSYALAIGLLSDQIAGRGAPLNRPWPRADRPLTRSERHMLQQTLLDKGYNPGPIDGIIGAGTKRALRAWQEANDLSADGYPSAKVLEKLIGKPLSLIIP